MVLPAPLPKLTDSPCLSCLSCAHCSEPHVDIAHRLTECQYELTDTLAYYLCSRKPDHRSGQHFIIPEMADSVDITDLAKAAKKKLQAVRTIIVKTLS